MGPKKAPIADEVDDIKKSLDFLAEECIQNAEKEKRLVFLENRVAELEQYTRINDVVVTGLPVKPRTYARAVSGPAGGEPDELDIRSTEEVSAFLESKGIELDCNNIEACHLLPRKSATDKPVIILKFVNRKHKLALLKQGRNLKGTNVYMNDHLTKYNADIARKARYLRKQGKIMNTWTSNCKVFIKLNEPQDKVLVIRRMEELDKYQ